MIETIACNPFEDPGTIRAANTVHFVAHDTALAEE